VSHGGLPLWLTVVTPRSCTPGATTAWIRRPRRLCRDCRSPRPSTLSQGPTGGFLREGAHAFARFGLFSGVHAPQAPDGSHGESLPVSLRPAWLVVVSGVESVAHGPRPLNGGGPRPVKVLDSWILAVIFDDTGLPHSIVTQTTENPAVV
jgi:hypothetical protein